MKVPIKSKRGEEILKYVVPSAAVNYVSRLHRAMAEVVTSVEGSVNLIVLRTPPATAMPVASSIDEAGWPEILGCIGGDDTILVIVRSAKEMPIVVQRFLDLKGTQAA